MIPNLSKLKRLMQLDIKNCINLEEIHCLERSESLQKLNAWAYHKLREIPNLSNLRRLKDLSITNCKNLEEIRGLQRTKYLNMFNADGCYRLTETKMKIVGQGRLVDNVGERLGSKLLVDDETYNGSSILCVVFAFKPWHEDQLKLLADELVTITFRVDAYIHELRTSHSVRIEDIEFTSRDIIYIHHFKGFDWFGFPLETKNDIHELNFFNAATYSHSGNSISELSFDVKFWKVLFETKGSDQQMPNRQSSALLVVDFFTWFDADDEVEKQGECELRNNTLVDFLSCFGFDSISDVVEEEGESALRNNATVDFSSYFGFDSISDVVEETLRPNKRHRLLDKDDVELNISLCLASSTPKINNDIQRFLPDTEEEVEEEVEEEGVSSASNYNGAYLDDVGLDISLCLALSNPNINNDIQDFLPVAVDGVEEDGVSTAINYNEASLDCVDDQDDEDNKGYNKSHEDEESGVKGSGNVPEEVVEEEDEATAEAGPSMLVVGYLPLRNSRTVDFLNCVSDVMEDEEEMLRSNKKAHLLDNVDVALHNSLNLTLSTPNINEDIQGFLPASEEEVEAEGLWSASDYNGPYLDDAGLDISLFLALNTPNINNDIQDFLPDTVDEVEEEGVLSASNYSGAYLDRVDDKDYNESHEDEKSGVNGSGSVPEEVVEDEDEAAAGPSILVADFFTRLDADDEVEEEGDHALRNSRTVDFLSCVSDVVEDEEEILRANKKAHLLDNDDVVLHN
ncbi:hypothetical protein NE237_005551 [Protea cynaroides]|uniref:Uncharacterized protein n=1 Tax=Protea cynaroides TaxID=273540 RepID=A0A9Q0GNB5_9MAGN|nr:hypothetical protein NE237_005551 [Protea cynaroides]